MPKLHPDLELELQAVDAIRSTIEHLSGCTTSTAALIRKHLAHAERAAHPAVATEIARREEAAAAERTANKLPLE